MMWEKNIEKKRKYIKRKTKTFEVDKKKRSRNKHGIEPTSYGGMALQLYHGSLLPLWWYSVF